MGAWLGWALYAPVTPNGQRFVLLRSGYSTHKIAAELQAAGVVRSADAFLIWQRLHRHRSLKAGEYLFEKPATGIEVFNRLARGDIYVHTVVIPEGYTMFDIAQAIQDAGLGTKEEFLQVAKSGTTLIADLDPAATSLEGYLFPNTYEFTRTQTMQDMAAAMVKQFREVAQQVGLLAQMHETVTLASIVEKETSVADERPLVASVYRNRMQHGILLQADPSVIYAELARQAYAGALHHNDLQFDSPYNTYKHAGLPPGPIANPGRSAIEAAMHPADTDFYYFVATGTGGHKFAHSLEEHNRNVAAYRKAMQHQ